jgi:hypothetical protein
VNLKNLMYTVSLLLFIPFCAQAMEYQFQEKNETSWQYDAFISMLDIGRAHQTEKDLEALTALYWQIPNEREQRTALLTATKQEVFLIGLKAEQIKEAINQGMTFKEQNSKKTKQWESFIQTLSKYPKKRTKNNIIRPNCELEQLYFELDPTEQSQALTLMAKQKIILPALACIEEMQASTASDLTGELLQSQNPQAPFCPENLGLLSKLPAETIYLIVEKLVNPQQFNFAGDTLTQITFTEQQKLYRTLKRIYKPLRALMLTNTWFTHPILYALEKAFDNKIPKLHFAAWLNATLWLAKQEDKSNINSCDNILNLRPIQWALLMNNKHAIKLLFNQGAYFTEHMYKNVSALCTQYDSPLVNVDFIIDSALLASIRANNLVLTGTLLNEKTKRNATLATTDIPEVEHALTMNLGSKNHREIRKMLINFLKNEKDTILKTFCEALNEQDEQLQKELEQKRFGIKK